MRGAKEPTWAGKEAGGERREWPGFRARKGASVPAFDFIRFVGTR